MTCTECGVDKDVSEFRKWKGTFTKVCNECRANRKSAKLAIIKDAEKLGFKLVTRVDVVCPHCLKTVGRAD